MRVTSNKGAAILGVALAVTMAIDVQAASPCVTTSAGLQAALDAAQGNAEPDDIRLRAGFTYVATTSNGFNANMSDGQTLIVSGGWDAGCAVRKPGARSTIDGQDLRTGMTLLNDATTGVSSWVVANLNFVNGKSASIAGGLGIQGNQGATTLLSVENNLFSLNTNTGSGSGAMQLSVSGALVVRGNLFSSNHGQEGAAALVCNSGAAKIAHNTVVGNDSNNQFVPTGGFWLVGNCGFDIDNNLFWVNQQPDLRDVTGMTLRLRNNNYNSLTGPSTPVLEIGKRNLDPQFNSFFGALKPNSPMVDAGLANPPAGLPPESLDGGPRITQSAPDIGAFELDVMLRNGFE